MIPKPHQSKLGMDFTVVAPDQLLDFLLKQPTGLSRNSVKGLLTRGSVLVNGKKATRHDVALKPGTVVRIAPPDDGRRAILKRLPVIYEDDELIAVEKPAGMLSIASEKETVLTAYHLLTDYVRIGNPKNRIFVVHRLDKETSGVMVAAKNEKLKLALQNSWNELVKTRGYAAVAEGQFKEKSGTIRTWLKETSIHHMYSSHTPGDGLEAITHYQVLQESATHALVNITIDTGRKNQIRVHLSELQHPVAGDKKYGAATNPLSRLCLHAGLLEVEHPVTKKLMVFESPLPKSFLSLF